MKKQMALTAEDFKKNRITLASLAAKIAEIEAAQEEALNSELESIQILVDKLQKYPELLKTKRLLISNLTRLLREAQEDLELAEAQLQSAIANQTNGAGKPVFSNDSARKAELAIRKKKDPAYLDAQRRVSDVEAELATARIELQMLEEEFSNVKMALEAAIAKLESMSK